MTYQELFNLLLKDIKVELDDEFDRNFERKAFFNTAWPPAKFDTIGSLLMRTGSLRKSIQSQIISKNAIRWQSSLAYADIHNSGGNIVVTAKMKGFFWYRYRMATGGLQVMNKKDIKKSSYKKLNAEAEFWKSMALKRVGSIIVIPKRQFIGEHPMVHRAVKEVTTEWFQNDVKAYIDQQLNNMLK